MGKDSISYPQYGLQQEISLGAENSRRQRWALEKHAWEIDVPEIRCESEEGLETRSFGAMYLGFCYSRYSAVTFLWMLICCMDEV